MPELVLAAPKAPVPLIHMALNRAARTFLKATRAWQEWLEPTDVTGEAFAEYTFELPQGAELLRLSAPRWLGARWRWRRRATFRPIPGSTSCTASSTWSRPTCASSRCEPAAVGTVRAGCRSMPR